MKLDFAFFLCALFAAAVHAEVAKETFPRQPQTMAGSDEGLGDTGTKVRLDDLLLPSQLTFIKQQVRTVVAELCGSFGIGVLFEDLRPEFLGDSVMDRLEVSISFLQGASLRQALDQLASASPDIVWRQHESIIVVSARQLAGLRNNPLTYMFTGIHFSGSVGEFLAKLYWADPANGKRRLSIMEGTQDLDSAPQVSFRIDSQVSLETLLAAALSRYGVNCRPVVTAGEVPLPFGRLEFAVGWGPAPRLLVQNGALQEPVIPTHGKHGPSAASSKKYAWLVVGGAVLLAVAVAVVLSLRRSKRSRLVDGVKTVH